MDHIILAQARPKKCLHSSSNNDDKLIMPACMFRLEDAIKVLKSQVQPQLPQREEIVKYVM